MILADVCVVRDGVDLCIPPAFIDGKLLLRKLRQELSGGFRLRVSDTLERDLPLGAVAELFSAYLRVADYSWVYDLPDSGADGESKEPESDQMEGSE